MRPVPILHHKMTSTNLNTRTRPNHPESGYIILILSEYLLGFRLIGICSVRSHVETCRVLFACSIDVGSGTGWRFVQRVIWAAVRIHSSHML